ncbi:hypothetical protein CALVIDRAFT_595244 [Calocera viscosa TUFC12733]|uniref:Uncharacterized protein n=1 Tax=Calocera viscosa (strain TUFC12733) TaxID=1330018 RepID=A0A167R061_CALVF|nr:hypothetical protein CALVIDRAFT_595244 [Calocera viscosa TUFC12733]
MMLFASLLLLISVVPAAWAAPNIAPYNAEAASSLSSTPGALSEATVSALLDILKQHNLESDYGIYSLHSHLTFSSGEAAYTTAEDAEDDLTRAVPYAQIAETSVASLYALDLAAGQLVPLEFTSKDEIPSGGQAALEGALGTGLLTELAAALAGVSPEEQQSAGLGLLTALSQSALADQGKEVLITPDTSLNTKVSSLVAAPVPGAEDSEGQGGEAPEPTLWAWTASGPRALWWCVVCGGKGSNPNRARSPHVTDVGTRGVPGPVRWCIDCGEKESNPKRLSKTV